MYFWIIRIYPIMGKLSWGNRKPSSMLLKQELQTTSLSKRQQRNNQKYPLLGGKKPQQTTPAINWKFLKWWEYVRQGTKYCP